MRDRADSPSSNGAIKILLVDDHAMVRSGLRALLEDESDLRVIGESGNGLDAIRMTGELQPEVLVLDIMMDDVSGIEVARQVLESRPETRIVILSMYSDNRYVLQALRAGAAAYVVKKSADSELVKAIREVASGRRYLGESVSEVLIEAYLTANLEPADPYDSLSSREREIFHLSAHSFTNTEIATQLSISRRTVETHRANGMRKLGLKSQTDLLRYALKRGFLEAGP